MRKFIFPSFILLWINFCCFPTSANALWDSIFLGYGPLKECRWRAGLRGGYNHICYTDRTKNLLIGQGGENGILGTTPLPCFSNQFQQPWTIGAHIGYNYSDHVELFLDCEYTHGNSKKYRYVVGPYAMTDKFKPYMEWSIYTGGRYYFPPAYFFGKPISPFIGAKLGITNYHRVTFKEEYTAPVPISFLSRNYYENHTVPSIGGQIGLEYFFDRCFSVNLMVEFIYSGQLKSQYRSLNGGDGIQAVSIGDTGPLFSMPITVGLNYTL